MRFSWILLGSFTAIFLSLNFISCKSCSKDKQAEVPKSDSIPQSTFVPNNTLTLPHTDTSLIPVLSKVVDDAFDASEKNDYNALGKLLVYRGPDESKFGYDVFDARNKYDRNLLRITADVFTKWNKGVETRDYTRAFEMGQPDGRTMPVLEVVFSAPKKIERKFFGFLLINDEWKIIDVTSYL